MSINLDIGFHYLIKLIAKKYQFFKKKKKIQEQLPEQLKPFPKNPGLQ